MANSCLLLSTDIFKCQTLFAAIHKFCTSLPPKKFWGWFRGAALRSASFQPEPVLSNAEGNRNLASVSRLAAQDHDIFDGKAGTFVLDLL